MLLRLLFVVIFGITVGCADGEQLEYHRIDQTPPGPGMVTGERGAIVIDFDSEKKTHSSRRRIPSR